MPRWEPDAVGRLQTAAIDLFAEQGFERTTVVEIAHRAGLTERTFFNHFADKREVLFGNGSEIQHHHVVQEITTCDDSVAPLDAVVRGLQAAADAMFEGRRDMVTRRQKVIEANPGLQERELGKRVRLTDAMATALQSRGLDPDSAVLTARAGMLVQQTAMQRWTQSAVDRPLRAVLSDALVSLRSVVA